jgi:hypothetical protein
MTLWAPSNYSAGVLIGWHDPSNSANLTLATGVSSDADLSTNAFAETQSTGANQPTVSSASINGLDSESFASTQNFTCSLDTTSPAAVGWVWLIKPNSVSGVGTLSGSGSAGGLQFRFNSGALGLIKEAVSNIGSSTSNISANVVSIVVGTFRKATGAYSFRINGTAAGSGSIGALTLTAGGTRVAVNGANASEFYPGLMGERITIASDTLSDLQFAEGYLAWKWGTVSSLDASHPYKSAAPTVSAGASPFIFPRNRHYVRR